MERPNHTIYINNLNEKVKKEGKNSCINKGVADLIKKNCEQKIPSNYSISFHSFSRNFELFIIFFNILISRPEEIIVCHFFAIWPNPGYCGIENP